MSGLLLIGGGGHCASVIDSILSSEVFYEKTAVIDVPEKRGEIILGFEIIGSDDDLEKLYREGYEYAFITLGSIGSPEKRISIYHRIKKIGFKLPNIVDKTAAVSSYAHMGEGNYIGKKAIVNAGTHIGDCNIINTACIVEHNCNIGQFVHTAPGSVVCGGVTIEDGTHIGANATVIQGIHIADNSIIGAGSVILKDVPSKGVVAGNPGRRIR